MIRYALVCGSSHEFEAWFSSSEDFETQNRQKLIHCPFCEDDNIRKQIMAPAVQGGKKTDTENSPEQLLAEFAGKVRENIRSTHKYVGEKFAEEARSMHLGETPEEPIYGEVSPKQAHELKEEGIPAQPLPRIFTPSNPKKIN